MFRLATLLQAVAQQLCTASAGVPCSCLLSSAAYASFACVCWRACLLRPQDGVLDELELSPVVEFIQPGEAKYAREQALRLMTEVALAPA